MKTNLGKRLGDNIFHIPSASVHVIDQNTKNSFIYTALTAWSEHYPLVLTPDDIWLLVLQGVAREVNENSEELRHKVVGPCSVGKKAIVIEVPLNMTTADYEEVGDQFRKAIGSETNPDFLDLINTGFSTTTMTDQMVNCVTVMDMCSKYFGYVMSTMCGFPSIVLEGTEEDWVQLRARAERLISGYCTDATRKRWGGCIIPCAGPVRPGSCKQQ